MGAVGTAAAAPASQQESKASVTFERDWDEPSPSFFNALMTYFAFGMMFILGHSRDFFSNIFGTDQRRKTRKGYAPLCQDYEDFYTRRMYRRLCDTFNRPIASAPDAWFDLCERREGAVEKHRLELTGETRRCLNLGSYNYLGFAAADPYCTDRVLATLAKYGASTCSGRNELGQTDLHTELEAEVAAFVGKPAAIVLGMGFATNSLTIPLLIRGKGNLIVSDSLNHASIVNGCRTAGAKVKVFAHNSPRSLEHLLRRAISEGQPRTRRPWRRVFVLIEGIYSMEGEVCRLPEIVAIAKKYKAYLYLDEAHSIGALGATGRGVCEHMGVDPADVDIMMGTFTKGFGSCGGYIAASAELVAYIRHMSPSMYAVTMSPPAVQQALSALHVLQGKDGTRRGAAKMAQLHDNSNFFRQGLRKLGCEVLGDRDSPVMPVMLYQPAKLASFSRECLRRHIAVVVVGFPATPLLLARTRICISAAHSRADLEAALEAMRDIVGLLGIGAGVDAAAWEAWRASTSAGQLAG